MKELNECAEYKELAMETIDGLISADGEMRLANHVNSCENCRKYLNNMQKIRETVSRAYEVPSYLEAKIMAKITGKTALQFNLQPVLSYAFSFGAVMLVALFIIYRSFDNKTVTVADIPSITVKEAAVKPGIKQLTGITVPGADTAAVKTGTKQLNAVIVTKTENSNPEFNEEHGPSVKLASNSREASVTAPKDNVVKTGESSGLVMLKPGVLPTTTDNTLLDRDLAIVANNLINPLRGEFATITIKVTDPSNVKIVIYDKSVRQISKILDGRKDRGTYEATWEGRTDSGETVSEGVYFVYIQIGTRVIKKSIIVNK